MIFNNSYNDDNNKNDNKNDYYDDCLQFNTEYKCLYIISQSSYYKIFFYCLILHCIVLRSISISHVLWMKLSGGMLDYRKKNGIK